MIWGDNIILEVIIISNHHIHTRIQEHDEDPGSFLTRFHGCLETSRMNYSWELLAKINYDKNKYWCIIEDFNEIGT